MELTFRRQIIGLFDPRNKSSRSNLGSGWLITQLAIYTIYIPLIVLANWVIIYIFQSRVMIGNPKGFGKGDLSLGFPEAIRHSWNEINNEWLVGGFKPTHFEKYVQVKLGSSSPRIRDEHIQNIWVTTIKSMTFTGKNVRVAAYLIPKN